MESMNEDLVNELEEFAIAVDDQILEKMKDLCISYGCSCEDIVSSWVAYSATKNLNNEPTVELLDQFEREELMKQSKQSKGKKSHSRNNVKMSYDSPMDVLESSYEIVEQHTPDTKRFSASSRIFSPNSFTPMRSTPSAKYSSRKTSGEIVCKHGVPENASWTCSSSQITCSIVPLDTATALQSRYTHMFEKLRDYSSILNDRIEDMASYYQNVHEVTEWAPMQLPALEPVPVVGRICSETGSRLSGQTLFIEGSQETCSGQVLPLDVSSLEEFSFFPGQIIAGEGINSLGKKVVLKKLYTGSMPPFASEVPDITEPLNVLIAAGPYTTSDSLSYEPLDDLIKYVKENRPHVCILCGPFVDIKHGEIEQGNLPDTYEGVFMGLLKMITSSLAETSVKLVLVPSVRDAHHDPVYPTPPYDIKQNIKNIYFVSDPCLLKINGVVFGITSTDILFHLGKEEVHYSSNSSDRLGRLCEHLLRQRNFYPLYPPSEDVHIDYIHYEAHCSLPVTPHVLVLPSDLKCFIKDISGCCCVNPERLVKGSVGGSFARMKINPVSSECYSGSMIGNLEVEIMKI